MKKGKKGRCFGSDYIFSAFFPRLPKIYVYFFCLPLNTSDLIEFEEKV